MISIVFIIFLYLQLLNLLLLKYGHYHKLFIIKSNLNLHFGIYIKVLRAEVIPFFVFQHCIFTGFIYLIFILNFSFSWPDVSTKKWAFNIKDHELLMSALNAEKDISIARLPQMILKVVILLHK